MSASVMVDWLCCEVKMMNEATREFVREHLEDDVRLLALRGSKDPEVDLGFALQQIDGRRRAQEKLPSWAAVEGIVWPPHLSMEQCSSEQTARYKAEVAGSGASRRQDIRRKWLAVAGYLLI